MTPGLVSTIVPVYNRGPQMAEAVKSVLAQDYRPIEVIVVDDGSTDDTLEQAQALAREHADIIRVIGRENGGPGLARETGRLEARGEFIQYLDSDDVLLPGKFTAQVRGLAGDPQCDISYGITRYRDAGGAEDETLRKGDRETLDAMFPRMLLQRWWDTPNPLYRRSVCDAAGPWSDLRLEEDWEYDCRIAALGVRLHHHRDYVCEVRDHEDGRLCRGSPLDPARLRERARAHRLVYGHARRGGIDIGSPAMATYARSLFLLARQCGAAGLNDESRKLFELAREASGPARAAGTDFMLYGAAARIAGWSLAGRVACWLDGTMAQDRGYAAPGPEDE